MKTVLGKLIFDTKAGDAGVDAQNGIEQPQWSPQTGLFYVSVPQVGPDPTQGGVSVIDPSTMQVTHTFLVSNCSPAGLALGPRHQALLGCSASFGTSPNVLTQSVIIDITSTSSDLDGAVVASVPIGGNDEVWFDKGTRHYFLAARANEDNTGKVIPILGSIDAGTNKLDPSAPTSTTAHSVAADENSHNVFVPIGFVPPNSPAGTDATNPCPTEWLHRGLSGAFRTLRRRDVAALVWLLRRAGLSATPGTRPGVSCCVHCRCILISEA